VKTVRAVGQQIATFWKEFAWDGRKVETRMIRLMANGEWAFATYIWNEA
jgi:hypothetical protein